MSKGVRRELNSKLSNNKESKRILCEALIELKSFQDLLKNSSSKYYGNLLAKIVGSDTIPFFLVTKKGVHLSQVETGGYFETKYFRIESIDSENCRVTISLLRPLDVEGNYAKSIYDVVRLEKTSSLKVIDLSFIGAVQPLDTELLKRKIIIEPKW